MLRVLRLGAVLLPASLLLHELAYSIAGGGLIGAHHYLEVLIPLSFALAASLAFAAIVLPALGAPGEEPEPYAPFALAGALLGIFAAQEIAEATLLGGGLQGLAASASVAWLAPPLALALGALAAAFSVLFDRAGKRLARRSSLHRPPRARVNRACRVPVAPSFEVAACASLAFGFARRPPPAAA